LALALIAAEAVEVREANAQYQYIVINNGLAPPNPDNVIDLSDLAYVILARNVDCPPPGTGAVGSCPSPGAPTQVEIVAGANLGGGSLNPSATGSENAARDTSTVTMSGGSAGGLSARESAHVAVTGGSITFLKAFDNTVLTFSGGQVVGYLEAWGNATVRILGGVVGTSDHGVTTCSSVPVTISGGSMGTLNTFNCFPNTGRYIIEGSNFAINGVPAAYGDYQASGTLTGTWASGESFSTPVTARLTLAPPAALVPALQLLPSLGLAAALLAMGAAQVRRQRAA
jgi:hypothetical protein